MIERLLARAHQEGAKMIPLGQTAAYIPELGKVDKNQLGICICTRDGTMFSVGDTRVRFSIQSISKVIALAVALEVCGFETVFQSVGMEPSGDAFNSLVKLEVYSSRPYNPMINSGAITICGYIEPELTFNEMLRRARKLCFDDEITLDKDVYRSEMSNISRNRAIAYLLESKGIITNDVERTLDLYVKLCSLSVTAESLSAFGMLLANNGVSFKTGEPLLQPETVRVVKTIMMTCGMYDGSGEFAVRVGIPSKSGVGGGILSVADRKMGIGIFGPSLDKKGNSIGGIRALECLSSEMRLHFFDFGG